MTVSRGFQDSSSFDFELIYDKFSQYRIFGFFVKWEIRSVSTITLDQHPTTVEHSRADSLLFLGNVRLSAIGFSSLCVSFFLVAVKRFGVLPYLSSKDFVQSTNSLVINSSIRSRTYSRINSFEYDDYVLPPPSVEGRPFLVVN